MATPAVDWTLDDFEKACQAISAAVKAGKVKGCYGPLPPLLGSRVQPTPGGGRLTFLGTMEHFAWVGFALGFGGIIVKDGHFDFTDPAAVEGLARLVQIARDYGASTDRLPQNVAASLTYMQGAAMRLDYYANYPQLGKGWRWVRFPRMPARPIVPTLLRGWALGYANADGQFDPSPTPNAAANDAAVQFAVWTYRQQRQNPGKLPSSPVVRDAGAHAAYWRAQSDASPLTDATDTWVVGQGWPALTLQVVDPVFQALSAAMAGGDLPPLLSTAAANLNRQIDLNAARVAAQAAQQVRLASAEPAFPVAGSANAGTKCLE